MRRYISLFVLCHLAAFALASGGCRAAAVREVRAFADAYESHLVSTPSRVHVDEIDRYLQEVADELLRAASELEAARAAAAQAAGEKVDQHEIDMYDQFSVYLVHSASPNAATPGDNCASVTTRLFLEIERPEQLYAVLAHELGHIHECHQIDQVERRKTAEVTVAVIAGIGAGLEGYANAGNPYAHRTNWGQVMHNAMSAYVPWRKDDEFEADRRGLDFYLHLGLDPNGYVSLFELFRSRWGDADSATHPRSTERIERLTAAIEEISLPSNTRSLDTRRLRRMQRRLANELESLQSRGFLVSEEIQLSERMASGALTSRISACGPLHLDDEQLDNGLNQVRRKRQRGW